MKSHGGFLMQKKLMKYIVIISMIVATFSTVGVPLVSADSPAEASNPYPSVGSSGVTIFTKLRWTGDNQTVSYDMYFGTDSQPPLVQTNLSTPSYTPGKLQENTTFYWQIVSYNAQQESTIGPIWVFSTAPDTPPFQPTVLGGPVTAQKQIPINFTAIALDPEADQVYYQWDWGDGNISEWSGPYLFGEQAYGVHAYMENGTYDITVRSKDIFGAESTWSAVHQVTIQPQFNFYNLHQGYVYLRFFQIDIGYGYSYALDQALWTMFVSNDVFLIIMNTTANVSYLQYKITNLVYQDEQYNVIDDNLTNDTSMALFAIDTGFYNITAFAYDAHGNVIGKAVRNWVIYINWKWPILKRIFGRKGP
jgi:hypothetical protein